MELGYTRVVSLKILRRTILEKSAFESYQQRKTSSNLFIILQLNQNRRWIFAHQNYDEEGNWKHCGFFDQSNYTEKSVCEKREYYDERNYV